MMTVGSLAWQNLDGSGLQDLEGLWAGHDASEAMLTVLLECEAFLPRQPACKQQDEITFTGQQYFPLGWPVDFRVDPIL